MRWWSVYFQLEQNTLGFLSVPTAKILKDWNQQIVGQHLENKVFANINWHEFFPSFGEANSILKFLQAL